MTKLNKFLRIVLPIIIVAGLGSIFVMIGTDWFGDLNKPSQWVPDFIIPIMWTIIYVSFAIILWRWTDKTKLPTKTKVLLIINGVLNVLWCLLFFTLKQTLGGNIAIILNLIFAILLWVDINKQEKIYSYILSIYPIWLCLATTLNTAIWILN